jgi:hypothetical protein
MKKQNYLIFGAIAVAGYLAYKKGLFGKKTEETPEETTPEETKLEGKPMAPGTSSSPGTAPTIIDISKGNITPAQAIEQAKNIVDTIHNATVLIKTKKGQKNIVVKKKKTKKVKKAKTKKLAK